MHAETAPFASVYLEVVVLFKKKHKKMSLKITKTINFSNSYVRYVIIL